MTTTDLATRVKMPRKAPVHGIEHITDDLLARLSDHMSKTEDLVIPRSIRSSSTNQISFKPGFASFTQKHLDLAKVVLAGPKKIDGTPDMGGGEITAEMRKLHPDWGLSDTIKHAAQLQSYSRAMRDPEAFKSVYSESKYLRKSATILKEASYMRFKSFIEENVEPLNNPSARALATIDHLRNYYGAQQAHSHWNLEPYWADKHEGTVTHNFSAYTAGVHPGDHEYALGEVRRTIKDNGGVVHLESPQPNEPTERATTSIKFVDRNGFISYANVRTHKIPGRGAGYRHEVHVTQRRD